MGGEKRRKVKGQNKLAMEKKRKKKWMQEKTRGRG